MIMPPGVVLNLNLDLPTLVKWLSEKMKAHPRIRRLILALVAVGLGALLVFGIISSSPARQSPLDSSAAATATAEWLAPVSTGIALTLTAHAQATHTP